MHYLGVYRLNHDIRSILGLHPLFIIIPVLWAVLLVRFISSGVQSALKKRKIGKSKYWKSIFFLFVLTSFSAAAYTTRISVLEYQSFSYFQLLEGFVEKENVLIEKIHDLENELIRFNENYVPETVREDSYVLASKNSDLRKKLDEISDNTSKNIEEYKKNNFSQ